MKNITRFPIRTLVLTLLLCLTVPLSAFAAGEIVVSADGSGQFTSITAAMNSITDASDTNRYLVTVKPGIYNEAVTIPSYVDLVGSGEGVTVITSNAASSVVTLGIASSLKNLTVDYTLSPTNYFAVAMNSGCILDHVTVLSAANGVSVGVSTSATIKDCTVSAVSEGIGVRGDLTLEGSTVYGDTAIQMEALSNSALVMRNSTASGVTKGLVLTNLSGDALVYDSVLTGPDALLNYTSGYGYMDRHALVVGTQIAGAYTILTGRDKIVNCIDGNFDAIVISSHGK